MKILMVDFDKTLYTDNYQQNVQMLNKFVEAGNKLILATGRNLYNLTPDLDPNLKFSYLVCSDGGIIFDNELNVLYRKDLISEVIKPIYDILKKAPSVGNPLIDVSEKYVNEPVAHANAIVARNY